VPRRQLATRLAPAAVLLAAVLSAATAFSEPIGSQVRVSHAGRDGSPKFNAANSSVAYSTRTNRYLVVWEADFKTDGEQEIFGRLVTAGGKPVGRQIRISDMGPNGNPGFIAQNPVVTYNAKSNEFLVVWSGDDNTAPLVNDEQEIFGQRLTATGNQVGPNDFRISDMGPDGNAGFDAFVPAVAYNSQANEYLVAWQGDDTTDDEFEIFGQRLGGTGVPVGANDFRISDMGPDGATNFNALDPAAAYDAKTNEYLVVWKGDDNSPGLVDNDFEVFGQRIGAGGNETGANDFRISDMGPDGSTGFPVLNPAIAFGEQPNEYLVVWRSDDDTPPLVDDEPEIFGQLLDAAGNAIGANDFRISQMGPDGNTSVGGFRPSAGYSTGSNEFLVVWYGDDITPPLVDEEFEIYGQRLSAAGTAVGADDFRLSLMGPDGDANFDSAAPDLAYGSKPNQYLVSWQGEDDAKPLVDNEFEIFARRASGGSGSLDRSRPKLKAKARRARGAVSVRLTCDERVSLVATARAGKRKLKTIRRAVDPRRRTALRFKLRGARGAVVVTLRATDTAGNSSQKKIGAR
jgi:hypothetical protein